jgi:hypothetical protein
MQSTSTQVAFFFFLSFFIAVVLITELSANDGCSPGTSSQAMAGSAQKNAGFLLRPAGPGQQF